MKNVCNFYALSCGEKLSPKVHLWRKNYKYQVWVLQTCNMRSCWVRQTDRERAGACCLFPRVHMNTCDTYHDFHLISKMKLWHKSLLGQQTQRESKLVIRAMWYSDDVDIWDKIFIRMKSDIWDKKWDSAWITKNGGSADIPQLTIFCLISTALRHKCHN